MTSISPALGRHAPIDMSPGDFRDIGHALVDRVADLLSTLRDRAVTGGLPVDEVRALVSRFGAMPDEGGDAASIVAEAADLLTAHSLFNGHPRFLGYITASPAPIGMLGDLLAAAVNPNVGAWALSPVATEIESQTIRWIAELLGYPVGCSGVLVSGGNQANFVGLYAALRARFPREDAERTAGLARATIYASRETHTWIEKAIDMFGLPSDALRSIDVDAERRLQLADLTAQLTRDLAAGRIPIAVVGTAGTVSTGAVDPLGAMAALCREHGTWFHVDGAYGGFAAMLDDEKLVPDDLHALALADSVAVDPHKWLYAPLEAGCALVRDAALHRAAFSYHPPYYHFGVEATNYVDLGPQNSRGFRALKVWMALRQVGRAGYRQMIGDDIALARALHERLSTDPRFEVGARGLSITTFRYVPPGLASDRSSEREAYLNRLNRELQSRLERSGELFVSNAVVDGSYLLRACIVNFRTSMADIDAIPDIVARHGEASAHFV
ncbi:MAG: aspartate aminotransferase family protein [Gemmatimonadaceae bacterium]|nr:aspartate aminotransferase family protein [Gemmatimonadaceae bacterium]